MKKTQKKKMGRPTKYKKKYCEEVIKAMAKGLGAEAFAGMIGVNRDTIYHWINTREDFSDAVSQGKMKMALFFEQMGIDQNTGDGAKGFSAAMYIFTMKNKLGWTDKQEVRQEITHSISKEDIKKLSDDELMQAIKDEVG